MANIGLRNAKYNKIDYTTKKYKTLTDSKVPVLGRLIDASLSEERNDTSLFADDKEVEKDTSFNGGTVTLTIDDVDDETYADVKGCTINEKEVKLFKIGKVSEAFFEYDGYKFYIEANEIEEAEFINLLKSILK